MMKKRMAVAIAAVFAFFVIAVATNAVAADDGGKVGFINPQKIVAESKLGANYRAEFDKLREKRVEEINKLKSELDALDTRYRELQQKKSIDAAELKKVLDDYQEKNKDYQRKLDDVRGELAKKDKEMVAEILVKADPIVKKIAKKRGFLIVIKEAGSVAYVDDAVDMTSDVIAELDKK